MSPLIIENIDTLIFVLFLIITFIIIYYKNKHYTFSISEIERKMKITLLEKGKDLLSADVYFTEVGENSHPVNPGLLITSIGSFLPKGYDFLLNKFIGDEIHRIPTHKHKRSSELFYVLKGKIKLYIYNGNSNNVIKERELGPNEWAFISPGNEHYLDIFGPSEFIIIAKPPLFSRMAKVYDKIKSKIFAQHKAKSNN